MKSLPRRFLLLDANLLAAYYAPATHKSVLAKRRITQIVDAARDVWASEIKLLVPNVCIAEVYNTLSKYVNPVWRGNPPRKKLPKLGRREYNDACKRFGDDIHNANLIEQWSATRYHVLSSDLVSLVDHNCCLPSPQGNPTNELGGSDRLIGGMAIWLARLLGKEYFRLVSADWRLCTVLREGDKLTFEQARRWGLGAIASRIDMPWHTDIYPKVIDLVRDPDRELRDFFGVWPLPETKPERRRLPAITKEQVGAFLEAYRNIGVPRDKLPYSPHMATLVTAYEKIVGRSAEEREVWEMLLGRLKQGGGRLRSR